MATTVGGQGLDPDRYCQKVSRTYLPSIGVKYFGRRMLETGSGLDQDSPERNRSET